MEAGVTHLKGVDIDPDARVVEELEAALELALSGEMREVAIIGNLTGNRSFTAFSVDDIQMTVGMLMFLQHSLCAHQRSNME